jgi:HSP20 family protein
MNESTSIDTAIDQVERLYRTVTGRSAPPVGDQPYATIPPEKVPEEHVQEQVDRLVETLTDFATPGGADTEWKPMIALWEGNQEIILIVDLPGIQRDSVHVAANRGVIQIQGERRLPQGKKNGDERTLRYAEQPFGKFRRTIPIPLATRFEELQAQMRDGILEIRVPRDAKADDSREIPVS